MPGLGGMKSAGLCVDKMHLKNTKLVSDWNLVVCLGRLTVSVVSVGRKVNKEGDGGSTEDCPTFYTSTEQGERGAERHTVM